MSGRVVNKMGLEEDNQNFLLMYSISVNVFGADRIRSLQAA